MDTIIIRAIKNALGPSIHLFDVRLDSVLVNDNDVYSADFSFEPKEIDHPEVRLVNAEKHVFQFDVDKDDGAVQMIGVEDSPYEVSAANIFAFLYWRQITESV